MDTSSNLRAQSLEPEDMHHQECLRSTDRAIGVGKISSEAESVSWLQLYLLFFWSDADIS
jgi:hypothetical protein